MPSSSPRRLLAPAIGALIGVAALAAPGLAGAAETNPWITPRTWTIAHQGGERELPSNTLYGFKRAVRGGADMLELDVGVTRDNKVVVMHDTTVDRVTNGHGLISRMTLAQIRRLDGAYWFSGRARPYARSYPRSAYRFRGVATGDRRPPRGYRASDFRVATLSAVLRAFPRTPINVEIKGRTTSEHVSEYVRNAEVLARLLRGSGRRDLVVASFKQEAIDRFHALLPAVATSPGVAGASAFLLQGTPPPAGTRVLQLPVTYRLGDQRVEVASAAFISAAHRAGLASHAWFDDADVDGPATWQKLIDRCVDGIMTARPLALARYEASRPKASTPLGSVALQATLPCER